MVNQEGRVIDRANETWISYDEARRMSHSKSRRLDK